MLGTKSSKSLEYADPPDFSADTKKLTTNVWLLLNPLRYSELLAEEEGTLIELLHDIVSHAARLSLLLRLDGNTVYHMPFTPKDETRSFCDIDGTGCVAYFSESHGKKMLSDDERSDQTSHNESIGLTEEVVHDVWNNWQELVRVICFDRVEAYRKGGWRPQDGEKGFRRRGIAPARVAVRWGRQADWKAIKQKDKEDSTVKFPYQSRDGVIQATKKVDRNTIGFVQLRDCIRDFGKGDHWYNRGLIDPSYSDSNAGVIIPGSKSREPQLQNWCGEKPCPPAHRPSSGSMSGYSGSRGKLLSN
jgi:hypothetical protein